MSGASVEEVLGLWSGGLREVKSRLRPLFAPPSVAESATVFLDGVLGSERRKTGWMRAEAAGDPGPWRQQAVVGRSRWDAEVLRDVVREYAVESLTAPDAVLVIDETGFLKQGKASCGVARQYTGSAGKITNCQIGVFAAYVLAKGHAFVDRRLWLPKAWTDDPARLAAAHVPANTPFANQAAARDRDGRAPVRHDQGAYGATHFLTKTLPRVGADMALHVLAYNLTRVMSIMGSGWLIAAIRA